MKTSEAILKGCEMVPRQAFEWYGELPSEGCVFGTIAVARMGISTTSELISAAEKEWTMLDDAVKDVLCPVCADPNNPLGNLCRHLNDEHRWTRERIAHWLDEEYGL